MKRCLEKELRKLKYWLQWCALMPGVHACRFARVVCWQCGRRGWMEYAPDGKQSINDNLFTCTLTDSGLWQRGHTGHTIKLQLFIGARIQFKVIHLQVLETCIISFSKCRCVCGRKSYFLGVEIRSSKKTWSFSSILVMLFDIVCCYITIFTKEYFWWY